jgi:hypothetical protein
MEDISGRVKGNVFIHWIVTIWPIKLYFYLNERSKLKILIP